MSGFDYEKEIIGYYKLWLGVLLVTDISLCGWLANNYLSAPQWLVTGAALLVFLTTGFVVFIGSSTESFIKKLKRK